MITRDITREFHTQRKEYPIVTVIGPRQAGKTTLVRNALPEYDYVSLEHPEARGIAEADPKAFLRQHPSPVILDEIQRVPSLLSYLQVLTDEDPRNGQYVLTGSHQLQLREAVAQSLAGRTGILHLLPLSIGEMRAAGIEHPTQADWIFHGFLPRVAAQKQRPHTAYANYYQTYVERDVRQLIHLKDATLFERFMKLLAGRIGQLANYQSMANDIGVDSKTIKQWLSILEASFIVFRLPPYFENFGKRVIKSPKYYFTDTGLACFLLGIEKASQVTRDPLLGGLFENLVVLEVLKQRYNAGSVANLYFFRDSQGLEIDLLHPSGVDLTGIEIKSAATWHPGFKKSLKRFSERYQPLTQSLVIYDGEGVDFSDGVRALPYTEIASVF